MTSIVSLQIGAVLAVVALGRLAVPVVACSRMLLAAGLLLFVARPRQVWARLRDRANLALGSALGVALAAMHICIYEAFARVPIGLATTLEAVGPLALATALSRRRIDLWCAVLAAVGVVLAARPWHTGAGALGVMFAVLAGVCWAAYIAINKRCARTFTDSLGLMLGFAIGGALLLPWAVVEGASDAIVPSTVLLLPVIAVLSSALPFSLETRALRRISARLFGILTSLYPAVGALIAFLILGQRLGLGQVIGMAAVITASVTALATNRRHR